MKFILTMSLMVLIFAGSVFALDPDPDGIVDTMDLVVTVDWDNDKVVAEAYCFTDFTIVGSGIGFSWGASTAELVMDSAVGTPLFNAVTIAALFEDDDINVTNANKRFVLGTLDFGTGIPGDAGGRRLWATYYFTITSRVADDCVIIDTMNFNSASNNLYSNDNGSDYYIEFFGKTWECDPTDVNSSPDDLPETFSLSQNYPNPFNPTTEIKFDIPTRSQTTLKVYNILGQEVETLIDEEMSPGRYVTEWDATEYSSGIYFYKINSKDFVDTKKMVLVK